MKEINKKVLEAFVSMNKNDETLRITNSVLLTFIMLGLATLFCFILEGFTLPESRTHVPMVYVLAVLLISRFTEGYFCGVLAAIASVVCVNYIFTYPYIAVDFIIFSQLLVPFVLTNVYNTLKFFNLLF